MDRLWKDLSYGARALLRTPGLTWVAVSGLSIAIGSMIVAFSFVNSVFLRAFPVDEPQRLVRIYSGSGAGFPYFTVSYPDYTDIRNLREIFSGVLVERPVPLSLGAAGRSERIWGYLVSEAYFSVLGIEPARGRFFLEEEGRIPGGHPVVVLSQGLWQRAFGGRPGILGETLTLNGHAFTVVGIAPEGFYGTNLGLRPALWAPVMMEEQLSPGFETLDRRERRGYFMMGRLQPGSSVEDARARLALLDTELQALYPDSHRGVRFSVLAEAEGRVHPILRGGVVDFSRVLVLVVVLILLLACANVAGLLLVRAVDRRKEIGLRLAVGASRGRIVRQLLTESALISGLAGGAGLALAWAVTRLLGSLELPTDRPVFVDLSIDRSVLAFSLSAVALTTVLFGLAPALQASKTDLVSVLKNAGRAAGFRRSRLRHALLCGQIALSTVLLVGAGLFLRSLENAQRMDVGFDPDGVVMASIDLGLQGYEPQRGQDFLRRLRESLSRLPGVDSVSLASAVPLDLNITRLSIAPEGYPPRPDTSRPSVDFAVVDRDYFKTMRTALLDGREFNDRDQHDAPAVVIVNEVLARRFWPDERAVGKRLRSPEGHFHEVVGVVKAGKYLTLSEPPKPFVYFPFAQTESLAMTVLVRAAGDPASLLGSLRDELRAMDETLPLYNVKTLSEHLQIALLPARSSAALVGFLGALALFLAAVGLFGMVAYSVAQRTHEIGVRRALGARSLDVIRLVTRQSMIQVLLGLAGGVLVSVAASRVVESLLYGVEATDPLTFTLAVVVLSVVALAACFIPAWRATRVNPLVALRSE